MSYMTSNQMDELSDFMEELANALTFAPSSLDYEVEIKVSRWNTLLGSVIKNVDGIVFKPTSEFNNYSVPDEPVAE